MKSRLLQRMLTTAIALPALSAAALAGGAEDFGCSNATLKGEYAFGVTNYAFPLVVAGSEFTTAKAISLSVVTPATAFQPSSRRQQDSQAHKRAPIMSIPTAREAVSST
jgi:hypothetical protein